jgi:SRSO17 transposase
MFMDEMSKASEARFDAYVESLVDVIGHMDRAEPLHDYCVGLLMPCERKSVEPMAAVVAPSQVSAKHQSLLHLVGQASWSDEAVLRKVRDLVMPSLERQGGPIEAWLVDDTGFAKKGTHSFGRRRPAILRPARQAGQLPNRGDAFDCQSCGEPADRLPALSAGRLEQG